MKAVLEEIEAGIGRFIPDDESKAIYSPIENLPFTRENIVVGKLYELTLTDSGKIISMTSLEEEQKSRMKRIKNKREYLLDRKNKE